jgi:hypothetical protein
MSRWVHVSLVGPAWTLIGELSEMLLYCSAPTLRRCIARVMTLVAGSDRNRMMLALGYFLLMFAPSQLDVM